MRIGILTNYHLEKTGGAEEVLDRLAGHWHGAGHDVVLFSSPPRSSWRGKPKDWKPAYAVSRFPRPWSTRFGLGGIVKYLAAEHRREPLDIVLASDAYWPGHVARRFREQSGVPYVICSHGSDIWEGSRFLKRYLARRNLVAALEGAAGIVCISSYMKSRTLSLARFPGPLEIIPNGWPDEWLEQDPSPKVVGSPYLLGMGRMVQFKGFQTLVSVYAGMKEHQQRLGLVLAGDGVYREVLIAQIQGLGLPVLTEVRAPAQPPPWVWLPGFVFGERKRSIIEHATIGVIPSIRQEPLAVTMLEFLSSGVPTVGSLVGGSADIIKPGTNGALFRAGDADELQGILGRLLADPAELARLAGNARPSVEAYRWSTTAQRYLDFFANVLRGRRAAA